MMVVNLLEKALEYPSSMDSNRLAIRYKEDGGINKDGVIELRRGSPGFIIRRFALRAGSDNGRWKEISKGNGCLF